MEAPFVIQRDTIVTSEVYETKLKVVKTPLHGEFYCLTRFPK